MLREIGSVGLVEVKTGEIADCTCMACGGGGEGSVLPALFIDAPSLEQYLVICFTCSERFAMLTDQAVRNMEQEVAVS